MPKIAAPPRPSGVITALVVLSVVLYLFAFRHYGFELSDEGTILYQIHRTASGQMPYRDFETGYTPGFFWLNAFIFRTMGESIGTIRSSLLFVHALVALGLVLISGRLLRPALAMGPALLWFAFLPVFPERFCSFNVPYPAWYALAGFIWAALAAMHWRESGRGGWLVLAALGCAFALACKPNSGAFAFAALAIVLLRAGQGRRDPLWWLVWVGVGLMAALAFGFRFFSADFVIYLLPVAVLLLLLAAGRLNAPAYQGSFLAGSGAWGTVALTAGAVSLPWILFLLWTLGASRFIREVALIGSGAEVIYYIPFPGLEKVPVAGTLAFAVFGVVGLLLAGVRSAAVVRGTFAVMLALGVGAGWAVARGAVMPEGLVKSVVWQIERMAFLLCVVVNWSVLAFCATRLTRASSDGAERDCLLMRVEVIMTFAICMFLQLYPRADFMHLVTAAPLSLVLGFFLLEGSLIGWEKSLTLIGWRGVARSVPWVAGAGACGLVLFRIIPNAAALVGPPGYTLESTRGRIEIASGWSRSLADLGAVVQEIRRSTAPGDPVFSFPALAAINFLSERDAPSAYDYFFPGRPDHSSEVTVLKRLMTRPPALVVTLNRELTFFRRSPAYYFLLRGYVDTHYRLVRRIGRFDLLGPNEGKPGGRSRGGTGELAEYEDAAGDDGTRMDEEPVSSLIEMAARSGPEQGQAVAALLGRLSGVSGDVGLEQWVGEANLARPEQLLLLRAIRDHGDERAASYLVTVFEGPDSRLAAEAQSAMYMVGERITVRYFLWGEQESSFPVPRALWLRQRLQAWIEGGGLTPQAKVFAVKVLGLIGGESSRQVLRRAFFREGPPVVRIAAAEALARLDAGGLACPLVRLLGGNTPEVKQIVPSLIVGSYARWPTQVRQCVSQALAAGMRDGATPAAIERAREAIWIALATRDGELGGLIARAARLDGALAAEAKRAAEVLGGGATGMLGGADAG